MKTSSLLLGAVLGLWVPSMFAQVVPTNQPPTVAIVSPTNGASFTAPTDIVIVANASDADDEVDRVEFFLGSSSLGIRTNYPTANPLGPFVITLPAVSAGSYQLKARATDTRGASTLSMPVTVSVNTTNPPSATNGEFVIRFEPASLAHGSKLISSWTESSFVFSTPNGMFHLDNGISSTYPANGSAYLIFQQDQKPFTIRNTSERLFSLLSVDVAEYINSYRIPADITFTGYHADNSSVTAVFRTDGVIDGNGPLNDFQTFTFGPEFSELERVEVDAVHFSLDNVRVAVGSANTNPPPERTIVNVFVSDNQASEVAGSKAQFTVRRNGAVASDLEVFFGLSGSASNGIDYTYVSNSVVIPAGATDALVDIWALPDSLYEGYDTVVLTLQTPVCAAIVPPPPGCYEVGLANAARVTIVDPNNTNVPPLVTIETPTDGAVYTAGQSIMLRASVFSTYGVSGGVTFYRSNSVIAAAVASSASFEGAVMAWAVPWNNLPPGTHTLTARASSTSARPEIRTGISAPITITVLGTISNPPPPVVTNVVYLTTPDSTAAETSSNAAPNAGRFFFERTGPTNNALQVYFAISGTASNGLDYLTILDSISIPAGASNASLIITPIDDQLVEPTETVTLKLIPSPAADYGIGTASQRTVSIFDNDRGPWLALPPHLATEILTNGCRLTLQSDIPAVCVIEYSTDLIQWVPIFTNAVSGSPIQLIDHDASKAARRYYRVRIE